MRAIILAAGEGKRLLPLTENRPKCMVDYQGKPILSYQLDVMRSAGISDIIVVKGYHAEAISFPNIQYVLNDKYARTNMVYTLFCARHLFDDDLLISYGDIIYDISILDAVLESPHAISVAVSMNWRDLWEKRMENPLMDAETLKMDENGYILELGRKPKSYEEIEGQYMGLLSIKKGKTVQIAKIYDSLDPDQLIGGRHIDQMFMTDFIQALIDRGENVKAVPVNGNWIEIDSPEDLDVIFEFATSQSRSEK